MDDPSVPSSEGAVSAEVINVTGSAIDTVEAEFVHIHQGGANRVVASEVELRTGGAMSIEAETVAMRDSVGIVLRGNTLVAENCGAAAVVAEDLTFNHSRTILATADRADMTGSSAVILIAREVNGSVEPMLDTRGAILAGAVSGIAAGLVLFAGSLLVRKRRG